MDYLNFLRVTLLLMLTLELASLKHCLSEEFVYTSYQRSIQCSASTSIQYPSNAEQLQEIIRNASQSGKTVKVFGSRHSATDIICTSGIPISVKNIKYMYFEAENIEAVTVGAGVELKDLLDFLHKSGRTLIHVPTFSGITIGGAIGTGAHGSSLRHSNSLSDHVIAVTIIDGLGNIQKIEDAKELQAFRLHLGLLGAIVDVTLKTVPRFKIRMHNYPASESVLFDGTALKMARDRDWFQLWWFPFSEQVVISEGNHTSPETNGTAETNLIPDLSSFEIQSGNWAFETMQATQNLAVQYLFEEFTKLSLYSNLVVGKPPIFTESDKSGKKKFVNPAVGWAYRLQSNRCSNKCAWENGAHASVFPEESSIAVEVNELPNVIRKIKQILDEIPAAFALIGVFIRFSKKSDALMSLSAERDAVEIEWATPMRMNPYKASKTSLGAYQAISQALIFDYDGRAHWGKNGQKFFTRKVIEKRPNELLQAFQNMMKKYDPKGIFVNNFGERILLQQDILTKPVQVKRCALQDYCTCKRNEDCAFEQVCTNILERYRVCKDIITPLRIVVPGIPEIDYNPYNFSDIARYFLPGHIINE